MQTYLDLHRHAAVRAALLGHPGVALRLMVAHAISGSHLWRVSPDPQATRNDAVRESVEACPAEALFDERRRAVLAVLGLAPDEPTVTGGNGHEGGVPTLFLRLVELPDAVVLEILTIVMGETLASGSAVIAALGVHLGVDMAEWWEADAAFFGLIRDREVLLHRWRGGRRDGCRRQFGGEDQGAQAHRPRSSGRGRGTSKGRALGAEMAGLSGVRLYQPRRERPRWCA
jgi:ParB family chromosome partitioning protein